MRMDGRILKVTAALAAWAVFPPLFAQGAAKRDALVLYNRGNYKEAVEVCEAELLVDPQRVESYVVMCWALVRNEQYLEAEQRATEGLKVAPYDLRLIEILGEARFYLGKNAAAMEQFQKYIASAPEAGSRVGSAYYFMGEIYIRQGRFEHADIALSTAVRKDPMMDRWWFRLGYAREKAKNYDGSLAAYEKSLELNPSAADVAQGRERVSAMLR